MSKRLKHGVLAKSQKLGTGFLVFPLEKEGKWSEQPAHPHPPQPWDTGWLAPNSDVILGQIPDAPHSDHIICEMMGLSKVSYKGTYSLSPYPQEKRQLDIKWTFLTQS